MPGAESMAIVWCCRAWCRPLPTAVDWPCQRSRACSSSTRWHAVIFPMRSSMPIVVSAMNGPRCVTRTGLHAQQTCGRRATRRASCDCSVRSKGWRSCRCRVWNRVITARALRRWSIPNGFSSPAGWEACGPLIASPTALSTGNANVHTTIRPKADLHLVRHHDHPRRP